MLYPALISFGLFPPAGSRHPLLAVAHWALASTELSVCLRQLPWEREAPADHLLAPATGSEVGNASVCLRLAHPPTFFLTVTLQLQLDQEDIEVVIPSEDTPLVV